MGVGWVIGYGGGGGGCGGGWLGMHCMIDYRNRGGQTDNTP